ncbi:hypothetical protein BKA66DRAFT_462634 [Pyrenochaeta sp. MPI-SDFR-AT-0127]|nr:hypothetical protein BKA66DRAFT_462634 [Pyrenochaeta sp. MPI-SDFR-AT-0127]
MANSAPNVWTQMSYVPPRGQCNHKASIIAPKCPCLRFMLHPLKSSSSYECDGCSHHASFHSMENKAEDEIRKRWELEAKEKAEQAEEARQRPKKRVRAIEYHTLEGKTLEHSEVEAVLGSAAGNSGSTAKTRVSAGKKTGRAASSRAKSKTMEIVEDDDSVVELD